MCEKFWLRENSVGEVHIILRLKRYILLIEIGISRYTKPTTTHSNLLTKRGILTKKNRNYKAFNKNRNYNAEKIKTKKHCFS